MNELIAVMSITLLAVISPGGDFAMVTRNSYLYGKQAGIWTALGIASAVWIHIIYTLLGVSMLLIQFPMLFHIIKIFGACYLIYIGIETYRHKEIKMDLQGSQVQLRALSAFKTGFFANALNPKTTLFILSTFTQIVQPDTSLIIQTGYGAFISLAHLVWFAIVATLLSSPQIRQKLLAKQIIVNRCIGVLLCVLGGMLLISSNIF
ncbi:LysE family translocator [Haemophilus haemoglobinophilus]|nr:LysE family translocator [Canicola haemoglobinophilus]